MPIPKIIFSLIFLAIFLLIYLIPTIVAFRRGHHNKTPILLVNILLGWSFLGCLACG